MIYYRNETLYIEVVEELDEIKYIQMKKKILGIIHNYGVDKIVILNHKNYFSNRSYLRKLKLEFDNIYHGELVME